MSLLVGVGGGPEQLSQPMSSSLMGDAGSASYNKNSNSYINIKICTKKTGTHLIVGYSLTGGFRQGDVGGMLSMYLFNFCRSGAHVPLVMQSVHLSDVGFAVMYGQSKFAGDVV